MTKKIGKLSAIVNFCAVAAFALCLLTGFLFGSYLTSMFIAFSFVPMICAFAAHSKLEAKAFGNTAMIFGGMYATFILLVYFVQVTTVRIEGLGAQAMSLLDYTNFGMFFNLNLLGYGLMSLSTFFIAFTIDASTKADRWLKNLMMIHGVFAITCFVMPMLGVFYRDVQMSEAVGALILGFWCAYFMPVGILSYNYFKRRFA
ncbi:MAG: hypothetical protein FWC76_02155 [Defluviitaleaceae bacterium]|nr:hypothetical protein [Defluviitaleaceae bacterium]